MSEYDYFKDFKNVSKTMLAEYIKSPVKYERKYVSCTMDSSFSTKRTTVGTIGHKMACEGKKLSDLAAVYPDECLKSNGDLNGKKAAEFRESSGLDCFKQDEYDNIAGAVDSIFSNPDLRNLIENATSKEHVYFSEVYGLPSKCKPDILCELDDMVYIYDLKFMEDISPDQFWRSARRFSYWLQNLHYASVVREFLGKPVKFQFFAIETQEPFRVHPYWYETDDLMTFLDFYKLKIEQLKESYETGVWRDNWQNAIPVGPWDVPETESEKMPFTYEAPENVEGLEI